MRKSYPPEIEAAWFALSPFINPIDCAKKMPDDSVIPFNTNVVLEHLLNKDPVIKVPVAGKGYKYEIDPIFGKKVRPHGFSKECLAQHYLEGVKHYATSRYDSHPSIGSRRRSLGSEVLYGEQALPPFQLSKETLWILVGFDVDAHHGEWDSPVVISRILRTHPGLYTEPATRGYHGYMKLEWQDERVCHSGYNLYDVMNTMAEYFQMLRDDLVATGLTSKLDIPLGMPFTVSYDSNGNWEDRRITVHRNPWYAIPYFGSDGRTLPSIERIRQFHQSPTFQFDYFDAYVRAYRAKSSSQPRQLPPHESHRAGEQAPTFPLRVVDYPGAFRERVDDALGGGANSYERTRMATNAYLAEHDAETTTVEEIRDALEPFGVWSEDTKGKDVDRWIGGTLRFWQNKGLGPTKPNYSDFLRQQSKLIREIQVLVEQKQADLTFDKGKGRRRGSITVDQLAAAYFALRARINWAKRKDPEKKIAFFSVKTTIDSIEEILGMRIGSTAAIAVLKTLRRLRIIWEFGNYEVGVHGQKYACRRHLGGLFKDSSLKEKLRQREAHETASTSTSRAKPSIGDWQKTEQPNKSPLRPYREMGYIDITKPPGWHGPNDGQKTLDSVISQNRQDAR